MCGRDLGSGQRRDHDEVGDETQLVACDGPTPYSPGDEASIDAAQVADQTVDDLADEATLATAQLAALAQRR